MALLHHCICRVKLMHFHFAPTMFLNTYFYSMFVILQTLFPLRFMIIILLPYIIVKVIFFCLMHKKNFHKLLWIRSKTNVKFAIFFNAQCFLPTCTHTHKTNAMKHSSIATLKSFVFHCQHEKIKTDEKLKLKLHILKLQGKTMLCSAREKKKKKIMQTSFVVCWFSGGISDT